MTSNKWKKFKLDEVYDVRSGLSKKSDQFGFGHDFLGFKEVFNNYFLPKELSELVNSTNQERERASIIRGDIFLTRTSETQHELGMSSVALKDYPNATFNGFTKRLRPNGNAEILPEYAGYYFRSPNFRNQVTRMSVLTTRASLNNSMLSTLTIDVPPMEIQESISNILMSIDYKIENNNAIITNLEEQAEAIFKSWFIDFEPFQNEEFIDTELSKIPKGWEVGKLGDSKLGKLKSSGIERFDGEKSYIATADVDGTMIRNNLAKITYIDRPSRANMQPSLYSIWFAKMKESRKLILVNSQDENLLNEKIFSTGFAGIQCNSLSVYYLWEFIKSEYFDNIKNQYSNGTTMQAINNKNINRILVKIPPKDVLFNYNLIMKPINDKISNLREQNDKLAKTRDILLPKLMSGEIQVEEAVKTE